MSLEIIYRFPATVISQEFIEDQEANFVTILRQLQTICDKPVFRKLTKFVIAFVLLDENS